MKRKPIGLTGNIGCGKSTVADFLRKNGAIVLDMDSMAKEILFSLPKDFVNQKLGADVFSENKLDTKKVAQIIFSDTGKRRTLEDIVHPKLWGKIDKVIESVDNETLIFVESAILYEKGSDKNCELTVAVTCPKDVQIKRLLDKRGMALSDIEARIATQIPNKEKEKMAQFVVSTDCDLFELEERVKTLFLQIKNKQGGKK